MASNSRIVRHAARVLALGLLASPSLALAQTSPAQAWPTQTIRIVVPSGAGTPPDILGRVIATEIGRVEGWTMVVENKVGAVQTVAGADVARSPANGHTLWAVSIPATAAPSLISNINYDLLKDFVPVVKLGASYNALVTPAGSKANSIRELDAMIKTTPGKLSYASGGFGTPAHLIGELFKLQIKGEAAHVPYTALPSALNDIMSGTIDYAFLTTLPLTGLVSSGKLKALTVTSPKRLKAFPNTPTVVEEGYPGLVMEDWSGIVVRAGTPAPVVARLNSAINRALSTEAVRETFEKLGAEPQGGTPEELGALIASEVARWSGVIKQTGIKMPN